jgi:hypothetical protein
MAVGLTVAGRRSSVFLNGSFLLTGSFDDVSGLLESLGRPGKLWMTLWKLAEGVAELKGGVPAAA